MATPTPKLKVTVDTDSASVNRVLAALSQAESNPDTVMLTSQDAAMKVTSAYQATTLPLTRPTPDVGEDETAFLAAALPGASKQARDKLRFLYAHHREGRNVFVSEDVETFGAPASEKRLRVNGLVLPAEVMSTEEFERYCRSRQTTGRWG